MAHCAPQQILQNINSAASSRYVSCGVTLASASGTTTPSARGQHTAAAGLPLCLCHLFRASRNASRRAWPSMQPGSQLLGEWPLRSRDCRRAASVKSAIPQRSANFGTISLAQNCGAGGPLLPALPVPSHGATIRLGTAPAVLVHPSPSVLPDSETGAETPANGSSTGAHRLAHAGGTEGLTGNSGASDAAGRNGSGGPAALNGATKEPPSGWRQQPLVTSQAPVGLELVTLPSEQQQHWQQQQQRPGGLIDDVTAPQPRQGLALEPGWNAAGSSRSCAAAPEPAAAPHQHRHQEHDPGTGPRRVPLLAVGATASIGRGTPVWAGSQAAGRPPAWSASVGSGSGGSGKRRRNNGAVVGASSSAPGMLGVRLAGGAKASSKAARTTAAAGKAADAVALLGPPHRPLVAPAATPATDSVAAVRVSEPTAAVAVAALPGGRQPPPQRTRNRAVGVSADLPGAPATSPLRRHETPGGIQAAAVAAVAAAGTGRAAWKQQRDGQQGQGQQDVASVATVGGGGGWGRGRDDAAAWGTPGAPQGPAAEPSSAPGGPLSLQGKSGGTSEGAHRKDRRKEPHQRPKRARRRAFKGLETVPTVLAAAAATAQQPPVRHPSPPSEPLPTSVPLLDGPRLAPGAAWRDDEEGEEEEEDGAGEPSTSYGSSLHLLEAPLAGWRRRRRLVELFPVPRPHRRKRRALAKAAANAAAAAAAAVGQEQAGDDSGGVDPSSVGALTAAAAAPVARRGREHFSFPFTVSRTSDTPIHRLAVPQTAPPPPPPPLSSPTAAAFTTMTTAPSVAAVGAAPSDLWCDLTVAPVRDAADTMTASALTAQTGSSSPPGVLVAAAAFKPPLRQASQPYALLASPSYVLYAVAAPEHRYVVYRYGPTDRWTWRPMLFVSGSESPPLLAVSIPAEPQPQLQYPPEAHEEAAGAATAGAAAATALPGEWLSAAAAGSGEEVLQDSAAATGTVSTAAAPPPPSCMGQQVPPGAPPLQFLLAAGPPPSSAAPYAATAAAAAPEVAARAGGGLAGAGSKRRRGRGAAAAAAVAAAAAQCSSSSSSASGNGIGAGGSSGDASAVLGQAAAAPSGAAGGPQSPAAAVSVPRPAAVLAPLELCRPGHYLVAAAAPHSSSSGGSEEARAPASLRSHPLATTSSQAQQQPGQQQVQVQQAGQQVGQPRAQAILRHDVALVVDASSLTGWRGREWDQSALALRQLWEASQRVRPGLLVVATSRLMKSLDQTWRDKQAFLPQPDVLLMGLGTEVAYRLPATAASAAGDDGGWRYDEQWNALLDHSYDAAAVRRAVDGVVQQYRRLRIAGQSAAPPPRPDAAGGAATGASPPPPAAATSGRAAVSYGLEKQQSRHKVCLEVHRSVAAMVVREVEDRLRAGSARAAAADITRRRSRSCSPPAAAAAAAPAGGVRFEVQPRGPRGEWCTVDVIPAAAGKAAALRHVLSRFGIDAAAVVAAGDTDRDVELLAAAGAAVVTAPRAPPALRELLLRNMVVPPQPPSKASPPEGDSWAPATRSRSGSSHHIQPAGAAVGAVGAVGAGQGVSPVVVQSARPGPEGVVEGLEMLGLL